MIAWARLAAACVLAWLLTAAPTAGAADAPPHRDALDRAWEVLSLPWMGRFAPVRVLRNRLLVALFPRYPYRDAKPGYLVVVPVFREDRRYRLWGGRLGGVAGTSGHGDAMARLEAEVESTFRVGARVRYERAWDDGRQDGGMVTATWRLLQYAHADVRIGVGPRWISGRSAAFGVAATVAVDLFPSRPWVVGIDGDVGTIGDRGAAGARVAVGRLFRAVEA
nr:hypothetical protein [Planctomycetota bacterium]